MTGKSPTVLVDGIVLDPRQQREVKVETNVHVPVTKKSVKLWRGKKCIKFKLLKGNKLDVVTREEKAQRLVLANRKLKERITELRTLNTKVNDEISEFLEQYSAHWKRWAYNYNEIAAYVRMLTIWTGKISAVLEDGIPQDPKRSEVNWFIYKVGDLETDGHAPITQRLSRGNIYMVTVEETQHLILENGKLKKQVTELLNLNAKAKDKLFELKEKKDAEEREWDHQFIKLIGESIRLGAEFDKLVKERAGIVTESV